MDTYGYMLFSDNQLHRECIVQYAAELELMQVDLNLEMKNNPSSTKIDFIKRAMRQCEAEMAVKCAENKFRNMN